VRRADLLVPQRLARLREAIGPAIFAVALGVAGFLLLRIAFFADFGIVKVGTGSMGLLGWLAAIVCMAVSRRTADLIAGTWGVLCLAVAAVMVVKHHQSAVAVVLLALLAVVLAVADLRGPHEPGDRRAKGM
jgi:hypothetical protein